MIVIAGLPVAADPGALAGLDADPVELTAEERRYARRRVVTRSGRVLTLALSAGESLVPGRVLHVGTGFYVVVTAAPEPLLAVTVRTPREGLRVALEVGRLHASLAVEAGRLLVPDDPVVERLLRRLDVPWVRTREPFLPASSGSPH